ncbi:MAG: ribosome maturation factor RimP [Candidatus Cloacimonadaceae bacterium]|jgi:ribosome maturation factor RimP|nr:ribosome maturation factor RimP [Candidatus Cloacimonadota bacterium]MCB5257924.1 ribosome maturation factor RimP [Candidatus Cloacimonadota bacterium]MDD5624559.1 ribosome maturation factor RimP [Candidatus Cloacimonadota bacterium]MDY0111651.1 ribosome maturation factor RimP [Candidatus Syntrophosphaera sp.]
MVYYRSQVAGIAQKLCADWHLALYDVEEKMSAKGRIITVYLTKIGGVTVDDCAFFSRALSNELDELDIIPERYFLEVSSPGLERPLKLKNHFVSAINEKVAVQWIEGDEKHSAMGTLIEVNNDTITLDDRGKVVKINFKDISRAKTVFLNKDRSDKKK